MTHDLAAAVPKDDALLETNLGFYDPLWRGSRLASPEGFNTWPLVRSLLAPGQSRLEVAPGLRPRLPVHGTCFVDASQPAIQKLRAHGALAELGLVSRLPFEDARFDLIAAFDIVEHVDDDDAALAEIVRVASPGAMILLSVPLHPSRWTRFDDLVGHRRRYEPRELAGKLLRHGLTVAFSAVYGMQPRSSLVVDFGVFWLTHLRAFAFWWYDRIILRFGMRFQKKLALAPGMIDVTDVDEVLLACRKAG